LQGPQAPQQTCQRGAVPHLPGVRQQRRQDQHGRCLRGRHHAGQQAHGQRRQAQADHALDQAGQQEYGGDDAHEQGFGSRAGDVVHPVHAADSAQRRATLKR
jgi:hypothetical protein